jgi:hypothetical protein
MGPPFTFVYARAYVSEAIRIRPAFYLANQFITLLWAVGFALAAGLIAASDDRWTPAHAAITLLMVLGLAAVGSVIIGLWFHLRDARTLT